MIPLNPSPKTPTLIGQKPVRRLLLYLHLCTGLLLSLYATVLGVSGTVLVFHDELTFLFDTNLHYANFSFVAAPDDIVETVRNHNDGWRMISLTWPNDRCPYWLTYAIRGREAREIYSSPQTGAIAEVRDPRAGFLGWLEQAHVNLLLGATGRTINGIGALLLLFMVASGIFLWWSGGRRRARRLFGGWSSGWRRWAWTLHQGIGVVASVFILIAAFTGAYFIWPQTYIHGVERLWPRSQSPVLPQRPNTVPLMTVGEFAGIAARTFPGRPIHRLQLVDRPDSTVRATLREDDVQAFHLVSTVILDPTTGDILQTIRLSERPAGDSILGWIAALHMGVFAGLFGKILWSLFSLTLPALAGTGVLMWWRRIIEPQLRAPK